jgi:N-glycosylase/DNA lyase
MKQLSVDYKKRKNSIKKRLEDFKAVYEKGDRDVFGELCFCLFTPQAKAVSCDKAVKELKEKGLLLGGRREEIREVLKGKVRFQNNKAGYCVSARELFKGSKGVKIKDMLDPKDNFNTREWLVKNVKGFGYKEASHFLRNIGMGRDLAILDVHILRNLARYGVIDKAPKTLTKKNYLALEEKMRLFSKKIEIPLEELDLLFWSRETGYIFK